MNILKIIFLSSFLIFGCSKKKIDNLNDQSPVKPKDPYHYINGKIQKGQSLAQALNAFDLGKSKVYELVNSLNKSYNLKYSHPQDSFTVTLDSSNVIQKFTYFPSKILSYHLEKDSTQKWFCSIDTLKIEKKIIVSEGEITTSLYSGMRKSDIPPSLIMKFTQIFQWDIDFLVDTRIGDKFVILYEEYYHNNDKIKSGNIISATYISGNYHNTAYLFENSKGFKKYYDKDGKSFQKAFLKSPLNYTRISSKFGMRFHPIRKKKFFHNGVDYAAPKGTPVECSADGTVIYRAWKGPRSTKKHKHGYGNTIIVRHANGYKTLYGHLSAYAKGIYVGKRIKQHTIIGYVGSTGLSTGNHLHYTIYHHGKAINPLKLKNVAGPSLKKSNMEKFQQFVKYVNDFEKKKLVSQSLEN
jgi:murein DD-endopeptidase MepM/ murein hydrolase activator NlpD